jgi:hypothetical protein
MTMQRVLVWSITLALTGSLASADNRSSHKVLGQIATTLNDETTEDLGPLVIPADTRAVVRNDADLAKFVGGNREAVAQAREFLAKKFGQPLDWKAHLLVVLSGGQHGAVYSLAITSVTSSGKKMTIQATLEGGIADAPSHPRLVALLPAFDGEVEFAPIVKK